MSIVPGLRSPYAKVDRLVYFGRMLDKIRLHGAGKLPADEYVANLGKGFDKRCCGFLRISYDELKARVMAGTDSDASLLAWVEERGGRRLDEDCELWNSFMMKVLRYFSWVPEGSDETGICSKKPTGMCGVFSRICSS